jgi:uncharacterized membrane protein YhaH (DUF805 family)
MDWFVLAWKKYAQFQGRSRRSEFWYFSLFHMLFAFVLIIPGVLFVVIGANAHNSVATGVGVVLYLAYFVFSLALLVPSVAVTVRRLHDTGRSGWWYFISFVPFAGLIVLLVFLCSDSQPGDNLYGPNPKGIGGWGAPIAPYPQVGN